MKFVVGFQPRASADVTEAFSWYEAQRPGMGAEFEADLDRSVELLKQMAAAGPGCIARSDASCCIGFRSPCITKSQVRPSTSAVSFIPSATRASGSEGRDV